MEKKHLLTQWERNNLPYYFYFGAITAIIGSAGLLLFDQLLFADLFTLYLPHRLTLMVSLSLAVLLFFQFKVHTRPSGFRIVCLFSLAITFISSLWYQYFLTVCPPEHYQTVLFGNIISIMALSLFTSIFQTLNRTIIAFSMASYSILSLSIGTDAYLLIISTLFAAAVCTAQRRMFATMLFTDYKNKRVIFDGPAAFALTVRRQDQRLNDIFPPRTSAVAILTADIRNSQCLFEANDEESQSKINSFFNLVNHAVDQVAPNTRKILKTHGDEINVILYSQELDAVPQLSEQIMAIAQRLALDVFSEARRVCAPDLLYDMGVSWGHNLVGLLGADGLKSPDVYGHVIVEAKRFQELAKLLRITEDFPIIVAKDETNRPCFPLIRSIHRPSLDLKISHQEVIVYKQSA